MNATIHSKRWGVVGIALLAFLPFSSLASAEAPPESSPRAAYDGQPTDDQLNGQLEEVRERYPLVARALDFVSTARYCQLDQGCFDVLQDRCLRAGLPPRFCFDDSQRVCCRLPVELAPLGSPAPPPRYRSPRRSIVRPEPGGYALEVPADLRAGLPSHGEAELTVRHRDGRSESVEGRLMVTRDGKPHLKSDEPLHLGPDVIEVLLGPSGGSCGSAEFGIGCYLAWCPTEVYCLPGPGQGGFQCRCL